MYIISVVHLHVWTRSDASVIVQAENISSDNKAVVSQLEQLDWAVGLSRLVK